MAGLDLLVRTLAIAATVFAVAVAGTHWAVRRGALTAFGAWPRALRRVSDPLLRPIETRIVRRGGNPQDAALWLVGIAAIGGLLLITATRWVVGVALTLVQLSSGPPGLWLRVAVDWSIGLLMAALIVRVIGSWVGAGPYTGWMRPVYFLTNWLVEPIRRIMPRTGILDFSPFVAYFALLLLRGFLLGLLR